MRVLVEKLVLEQMNVVFGANTQRWNKTCNSFASKHLVALEKVLGSWRGLANKILKTKGNTDAISKAVVVENMDADQKVDELVMETIGNDEETEGKKERRYRE